MASRWVLTMLIFHLTAFALAVSAELLRSTAVAVLDKEGNYIYCVYDSDIATMLGVVAGLFLLAGHALIMAATKCASGLHCHGRERTLAIALFAICWLTFLIAEAYLLVGSVENADHTKYRYVFVEIPLCKTLRKGVFATGGFYVLYTATISLLYIDCHGKAVKIFNVEESLVQKLAHSDEN